MDGFFQLSSKILAGLKSQKMKNTLYESNPVFLPPAVWQDTSYTGVLTITIFRYKVIPYNRVSYEVMGAERGGIEPPPLTGQLDDGETIVKPTSRGRFYALWKEVIAF
jgi:hypothetical protein